AHPPEHGARARSRVGAAGKLEGQHHVLQRGERREKLERLEHESHHAPAQPRPPVLGEREEVFAVDEHAPGGRNVQAREQSQQGGLARTRGAKDRHRLARAHLEGRVLDDRELVVGRGDLFREPLTLHNRRMIRVRHWLCAAFLFVCAPSLAANTVMVFGDSLSAAYNLSVEQGWVHILARRIESARLPWKVVNASVSGETTGGGLSRIPEDLRRHKPSIVVIELGANDALRGLPIAGMRKNLGEIVRAAKQARAEAVLVGMRIPPNYGIDYA